MGKVSRIYEWDGPREPLAAMALGPIVVPAGEQGRAHLECQCQVRPTGLVIPPDVAEHFDVLELQCGRVMMLMGVTGVPATTFSGAYCKECHKNRVARLLDARWPILQAGVQMFVVVKNSSSEERVFTASLEVKDVSYEQDVKRSSDLA